MKQSGPEVSYSNDFLGGRHNQEVTTASAIVEIIQDFVSFVNGKTSPKDGIDPAVDDYSCMKHSPRHRPEREPLSWVYGSYLRPNWNFVLASSLQRVEMNSI
jgi:hypothetical protein